MLTKVEDAGGGRFDLRAIVRNEGTEEYESLDDSCNAAWESTILNRTNEVVAAPGRSNEESCILTRVTFEKGAERRFEARWDGFINPQEGARFPAPPDRYAWNLTFAAGREGEGGPNARNYFEVQN